MHIRLGLLASFLLLFSFAGCGDEPVNQSTPPPQNIGAPPIDPNIFPKAGATSFLTANELELLSSGTSNQQYSKGYNGKSTLDAAAGAGENPGVQPPPTEPPPDPTREIVEADVFKLEGDLLYVLNRYRGLVIIDVSNPDKMFIRGRLPFQAMPVEMYIRDGRAYVVSSDYFVYWQYDPEADPHGFHGSQVMIADVSNPDDPKQLGSLHVDGEVTDTRMVGDVLYTVSKRRADYWRYNTADWEDTHLDRLAQRRRPGQTSSEIERITFQGTSTLIHVAHHAIFVAAWDPNYYLTNPTDGAGDAGDLRRHQRSRRQAGQARQGLYPGPDRRQVQDELARRAPAGAEPAVVNGDERRHAPRGRHQATPTCSRSTRPSTSTTSTEAACRPPASTGSGPSPSPGTGYT